MKSKLIALCSALALNAPAAVAADFPVRPAAPAPMYAPTPVYNWSGFYVGANLGAGWASMDMTGNWGGARWGSSDTRFIVGGQVGFNYQIDHFVMGAEWDFDWADGNTWTPFTPTAVGPLRATVENNWVMTLAARLGYAFDNWLFYGKLGAGWTKIDARLWAPGGAPFGGVSRTNVGWLVGAGVEYAFARNWTGKVEYNYLGLDDTTFSGLIAPTRVTVSPDVQMVKFGINYKFGF